MNKFINLIVLSVLVAAGAQADIISVTFDQPNQSGLPGDTLSFYATISNNDTNQSDAPVYFNTYTLDFSLTDATLDDAINFFNTPVDLGPGQSATEVDLFDVTIANPGSLPAGTYGGTYTLIGGPDGGDGSANDILAQTNFTVTVEPEPATVWLLGGAMALFVGIRYGRRSSLWRRASSH